jgi:hypothetical protein
LVVWKALFFVEKFDSIGESERIFSVLKEERKERNFVILGLIQFSGEG